MDTIAHLQGLRAARLDRILDALAGRAPVAPEPRRRRRARRATAQPLQLGLRFLPTV